MASLMKSLQKISKNFPAGLHKLTFASHSYQSLARPSRPQINNALVFWKEFLNPKPYSIKTFSTSSNGGGFSEEMDAINSKFAEAREEIEMAMESKETVYFNEEAESARAVVKETLDMFNALLDKLSEAEKSSLQRSMGLKMEQLKAELAQLNE